MAYGVVYKITNTVNGKIYIGQTTRSVEQRFKEHLNEETYIGNSMRKHGIKKFTIEVIAECETPEELNACEIAKIDEYDCMAPKGYNLTTGVYNGSPSKQTKDQIALKLRGRKQPKEVLDKKAAAKPGVQEKKAAAMNKYYEDPAKHEEHSAIMIEYYRIHGGPKHSKKTKDKIAETLLGRKDSAEVKAHKTEAQKKRRAEERVKKLPLLVADENRAAARLPEMFKLEIYLAQALQLARRFGALNLQSVSAILAPIFFML